MTSAPDASAWQMTQTLRSAQTSFQLLRAAVTAHGGMPPLWMATACQDCTLYREQLMPDTTLILIIVL